MTNQTMQKALRQLIANDAYAMTFQTMGEYRTALLQHLDQLLETPTTCSQVHPDMALPSIADYDNTERQYTALARCPKPEREAPQPACTVPPEGWCCTRARGHEGPCAALPVAAQSQGAQAVHDDLLDMLGRVHPYAMPMEDFKRSEERLQRAVDLQQPTPVPDQAAIVWRGDLMRLIDELQHKRSVWLDWKRMRTQQAAAPGALTDEQVWEHYKELNMPHAPAVWQAALATVRSIERAQRAAGTPEAPAAWMDPNAGCVMDAFLWQKDPSNPQYSVPVYRRTAQLEGGRGETK